LSDDRQKTVVQTEVSRHSTLILVLPVTRMNKTNKLPYCTVG